VESGLCRNVEKEGRRLEMYWTTLLQMEIIDECYHLMSVF